MFVYALYELNLASRGCHKGAKTESCSFFFMVREGEQIKVSQILESFNLGRFWHDNDPVMYSASEWHEWLYDLVNILIRSHTYVTSCIFKQVSSINLVN